MSTEPTPTVEAPVNVVAPTPPAIAQTPDSSPPVAVAAPQPTPAAERTDPVKIDRPFRPRSDDDVRIGHFADVVSGEHKGRYGVYTNTAEFAKNGIPTRVIVRTRDDRDESIVVAYDAIRPSVAGKR